jgi:UDP:flavonoid glycosyltransferase YjiC (YdhE family)
MPFDDLTSDCLSKLLGEVLDNPVYRENARKLQEIIAKTNGLSMAADIVERSFGVKQSNPDSRQWSNLPKSDSRRRNSVAI